MKQIPVTRESGPSSASSRADDVSLRTDELLVRYLDDADSLTPSELLELAAAILEKSLSKQKYRRAAVSAVVD